MKQFTPDSLVIEKKEQQEIQIQGQKQEKILAQQANHLYDDIHQIAGDLRFIKNLNIFYLVGGIISALIVIFKIM